MVCEPVLCACVCVYGTYVFIVYSPCVVSCVHSVHTIIPKDAISVIIAGICPGRFGRRVAALLCSPSVCPAGARACVRHRILACVRACACVCRPQIIPIDGHARARTCTRAPYIACSLIKVRARDRFVQYANYVPAIVHSCHDLHGAHAITCHVVCMEYMT